MIATLFVWKYKNKYPGGILNYFIGSDYLDFVDKINCGSAVMEVPIFSDRLEKQNEVLEFAAPDFDVKLDCTGSEVSDNGDPIQDFFFNNEDGNCLYIAVFGFGQLFTSPKIVSGKIKIDDLQYDDVEKILQFTCIGMAREMADYWSKIKMSQVSTGAFFYLDGFLESTGGLFPTAFRNNFSVATYLDLVTRFGFNRPQLITELYNDIVSTTDQNIWGAFKDIARGFGFLFRSELYIDPLIPLYTQEFPGFILICFWRTAGDPISFGKMTDITRYSDVNNAKYNFLMTYRDNVGGVARGHGGCLLTSDNTSYIGDGWVGSRLAYISQLDEELIEVFDKTKDTALAKSNANFFALATYPTRWRIKLDDGNYFNASTSQCYESFFSCFCISYVPMPDPIHNIYRIQINGQRTILELCPLVEYAYQVGGLKKFKEYEIVFEDTPILEIGNTITVDGIDYWLKAVNDIDIGQQVAKTEWIQV